MSTAQPAPGIVADDQYFKALLNPALATNVAVQEGNWSDPNTWQNGLVPGDNAKVYIPEDVDVVYDLHMSPRLHWIRLEGCLEFHDEHDQSLTVETITVIGHHAELHIGDEEHPREHNLTVTFIDNGPISDSKKLSRGLISDGHASIYGKPVLQPILKVVGNVPAGSNKVTVLDAHDWKVGDKVVLAGTGLLQSEFFTIAAISEDGLTFTFNKPTVNARVVEAGKSCHIGHISRTINFTSENKIDSTRFGHIMFMMEPFYDVQYVSIEFMGRTDKSKLIDDLVNFHQNNGGIPGGGTNPRGRYALHIHRTGLNPDGEPAKLNGIYAGTGPGWGLVNHSSNVLITNSIAYNFTGAGFSEEIGNGLGSFENNLALDCKGAPTIDFSKREGFADWGFEGGGFSFMGTSTSINNNISAGCAVGYRLVGVLVIESGGILHARVPVAAISDPSIWDGKETLNTCVCVDEDCVDPVVPAVRADFVSIKSFMNNEAYGCYNGFTTYSYKPKLTAKATNTVGGFSAWNISNYGINFDYSNGFIFRNLSLLNNKTGFKSAIRVNAVSDGLTILNGYIRGWTYGLSVSGVGITKIIGGYWNNSFDFDIPNGFSKNRSTILSNIVFGEDVGEKWLMYRIGSGSSSLSYFLTYQGNVIFDNQYVYAPQQDPNYIPFPTNASVPDGPNATILVGKTNAELMLLFGLCVNGVITPAGTQTNPRIIGTLGKYSGPLPELTLLSPAAVVAGSSYKLRYSTPATAMGASTTITETVDTPILKGYNVVTRTVMGIKRSFLIYGT